MSRNLPWRRRCTKIELYYCELVNQIFTRVNTRVSVSGLGGKATISINAIFGPLGVRQAHGQITIKWFNKNPFSWRSF